MAIRTKLLARGRYTGDATVYTVPAGKTGLAKYLTFANTNPTGITVNMYTQRGGVERALRYITLAGYGSADVTCFVVLAAGDSLVLRGGGAGVGMDYHVMGAELEGVA